MDPKAIIERLQEHERDHAAHNDTVRRWLRDAGFHWSLNPCRVTLHVDTFGVWCGNSALHATRAIELDCTPTRACARLVSYGGHRTYHTATGASPVEALGALAASDRVPAALLAARFPAPAPEPA